MSMVQEFKAFALKGNVMDLAVGVIIGGAFSTIVNSIVKDLIMPVVGLATGGLVLSPICSSSWARFHRRSRVIPARTRICRLQASPYLATGRSLRY